MQTETITITVEAILPTQQYGHLHFTVTRSATIEPAIADEVAADLLRETREIVIAEVLKQNSAQPLMWESVSTEEEAAPMTTNESGERSRTTTNFKQLLDLRHQNMLRTRENYRFAVGLLTRALHENDLSPAQDDRITRLWEQVTSCREIAHQASETYRELLPVPEKRD